MELISILSTLVCNMCIEMNHRMLSQVTGCIISVLFMRLDASIYGSHHDGVNHIAEKGVDQVWRANRRHLSYPMILSSHGSFYTYDYSLHD